MQVPFYVLRRLVNSTKLPVMVLAWDKLQEVFVMLVVVVVLPHWRFFVHCFLTLSLILPWAIAGFLQQFCNFSPADAFIWTFLGFSVTVLPRVVRFWAEVFYPQAFLPCTPSPHFGTFLWLRCGQGHPIQDPSLCLPSQGCPFRLTHGLELLIL